MAQHTYAIIEIDRLSIFAHHGVMEQERTVGNTFEVSVRLKYPSADAIATDNIDKALNYAEAVEIIRMEMSQPAQLLEHLCGRIADALCRRWPAIDSGIVKVTKVTPPVGAKVAGISVTVEF